MLIIHVRPLGFLPLSLLTLKINNHKTKHVFLLPVTHGPHWGQNGHVIMLIIFRAARATNSTLIYMIQNLKEMFSL